MCSLLLAYAVSVIGGAVATYVVVEGLYCWLRQRRIVSKTDPERLPPLLALLGMLERAVITTFVIYTPTIVPTFIGGWVLLKFAGGWGRFKGESLKNRVVFTVFLVGNIISIAFAVGAGLWHSPGALDVINATSKK